MLAILMLIFGLVAIVTVASANICNGLENHSLVRNIQNCSEYFHCIHGSPALDVCPTDKQFNHITGSCDDPSNVKCFECPIGVTFADLPVPNICNQFVRCYNGRLEQHTCADGLAFDQNYAMCNMREYVECPFTVECPPNNNNLIITRDPENCAKYYVCVSGVPQTLICPAPLQFNLKTLQCDLPDRADCKTQPQLNDLMWCPRDDGPLFAVQSDNTLSYRCNEHDIVVVHQCRPGLIFNYHMQGCIRDGDSN